MNEKQIKQAARLAKQFAKLYSETGVSGLRFTGNGHPAEVQVTLQDMACWPEFKEAKIEERNSDIFPWKAKLSLFGADFFCVFDPAEFEVATGQDLFTWMSQNGQ